MPEPVQIPVNQDKGGGAGRCWIYQLLFLVIKLYLYILLLHISILLSRVGDEFISLPRAHKALGSILSTKKKKKASFCLPYLPVCLPILLHA
jgi:hypothetical protein